MDRRSLDHRLNTESIDMKISFFILMQKTHKTHFHQNCFALSPILEVGVFGPRCQIKSEDWFL